MSLRQVFRYAGITLGIAGAALAIFSIVEVDLARGAEVYVWLIPEIIGLLLVVIGLHAWIDWSDDA